MKNKTSWDDESNEVGNSFVAWSEVGDYILGTLVSVKESPSTLPDKAGEMQKIYGIKVRDCSYHNLDEKKRIIPEAVVPLKGSVISVGGRKMIDSRMAQVRIGQIVGLKFVEELAAKTKGYNATKLIKVFTPKLDNGEFEMDEEFIAANDADNF